MEPSALQLLAVFILCVHASKGTDLLVKGCFHKRPLDCWVPPPPIQGYNETHVYEQLQKSVIYATTHVTVYSGQIATFQYILDMSVVSDIESMVYINGCRKNTVCSSLTDNEKQTVTVTCTIANGTNGTTIEFFSFSKMFNAQLCHEPLSLLTVLGPPLSHVSVDYSIDPSDGVTLTTDPSSIDTSIVTSIQYNLYDDHDNLLHTATFINNTIAVIQTNLFHNHTGIYRITIIPSNPAGNGPSTNITINLTNANYSLEFDIQNTTIFTDANKNFIMIVTIEVNNNSLLTVPNYLYLTTSCSNQEEVEHIVNITNLINHHSNQIFINLELLPGRRNCNLTIKDETDNTLTITTNQSTYYTTSYKLVLQNDSSINISCFFIEGVTTIDGCIIIIYDSDNNRIDQRVFHSTDNVINLGPYNPGEYSVDICDINNNGQYNSSDPVFTDTFTITNTITTTTIITTTTTTTSSPLPTITVDPGGDGSTTEGTPLNHNYLIIVIVVAVVVIIVVVLIAVTVIVRWQSRRGNFNINNPAANTTGTNGSCHGVDANGGGTTDPYIVEATTDTATIPNTATIPTNTTNDVPQQPHAQVSLEQHTKPALLNSDRPCDLSSRNDHPSAIEMTTTTTTMDHDSDIAQNSFFEFPEEQSGNESVSFSIDPLSTPLQSPVSVEGSMFFRQESTASNNTIIQSSTQRRSSCVKLSGNVIGDGLSVSQRNESIVTLKDELLITSTYQLPPIDTGKEEHTLSIHDSIAAQEDEKESKSAAIVSHTGNGDDTTSPTGTDSARSETYLLQDVR